MSRIGQSPIPLPDGVAVTVELGWLLLKDPVGN
jgi:ribosomal protein L6P/L9E